MPRNISFMLTTEQFKNRSKTVTRRMNWQHVKVGDILCGVEKCQGLKKGEKIKKLGLIRVTDVRREPLWDITDYDCLREGFPHWAPQHFVRFFCKHNKCEPDAEVTRIEFEYLD